jgi:hypothetical protein
LGEKFSAAAPEIEHMADLLAELERTNANWRGRSLLGFALGKVCLEAGDADRAFAYLREANRLKRESLRYDAEAEATLMREIARIMSASNIKRLTGNGVASDVPVFIIGMPRSGTTLIEQILASHPAVHGAGELMTLPYILGEVVGGNSFEELLSDDEAGGALLHEIGRRYLDRVTPLAPDSKRIVDKMPTNFQLAGLIPLALPGARIIHCRRDPVDTCLSCYSHSFQGGLNFTYDLRELGLYYRAYDALTAHWRAVLPPERYTEVQYESVVEDVEAEARRLIAFCGLDWDDACLDFHRSARPVQTASVEQVRQPIYKSSVRRWEKYASYLQPLLKALKGEEA